MIEQYVCKFGHSSLLTTFSVISVLVSLVAASAQVEAAYNSPQKERVPSQQRLKSPDSQQVISELQRLADREVVEELVPTVIGLLNHASPKVGEAAAAVLCAWGPSSVPGLLAELTKTREYRRPLILINTIEVIDLKESGKSRFWDREVSPGIQQAIRSRVRYEDWLYSKDEDIHLRALTELDRAGKTEVVFPYLVQAIRSSDLNRQLNATALLVQFGERGRVVLKELTELHLRLAREETAAPTLYPDSPRTESALLGVGKPASSVYMKFIRSDNPILQLTAIRGIARLQDKPPEALPLIRKLAQGEDLYVAGEAIDCLGQFGPQAASAIGILKKLFASDSVDLRIRAAAALALVDPADQRYVNYLIRVVKEDRCVASRQTALSYLVRLGPTAKPGFPVLAECLRDDQLRTDCFQAIAGFGTPAEDHAEPVLVSMLQSRETERVISSLLYLGDLRSVSSKSIDAVRACLRHPSPDVRAVAVKVIATHVKAVPLLRDYLASPLTDKVASVRLAALSALRRSDPQNPQLIPLLLELCEEGKKAQLGALRIAAKLPSTSPAFLPVLTAVLLDASDASSLTESHELALELVGKLGRTGAPLAPILMKLKRRSHNPYFRDWIDRILVSLKGP